MPHVKTFRIHLVLLNAVDLVLCTDLGTILNMLGGTYLFFVSWITKFVVWYTTAEQRTWLRSKFPNLFRSYIKFLDKSHLSYTGLHHADYFDKRSDSSGVPDFICQTKVSVPRIRIVSPLFPTTSGIASFTKDLAQELSKHVPVELRRSYFENGVAEVNPGVRSIFYSEKQVERVTLYMLGNGPHHQNTWNRLVKEPGFVMVHDARIPNISLTPEEDPIWDYLPFEDRAKWFLGRLPLHTRGILTMSQETTNLVLEQLSLVQKNTIPAYQLSTSMPSRARIQEPRALSKRPTLGTFGFQNDQKNPRLAMEYISRICAEVSGKALVCGPVALSLQHEMTEIWTRNGLRSTDLEFRTNLTDEEFDQAMSEVDFAVQFRKWSNGETSAVIPQLASHGIPTAVNNVGSFRELDPNLFIFVESLTSEIRVLDFQNDVKKAINLLRNPETYTERSKQLIEWASGRTFEIAAREIADLLLSDYSRSN